jgi:serine protease Do
MKRMVKLVAGAAAFGIIAGTTFQGVNMAADNLFGPGTELVQEQADDQVKLSPTSVVNTSGSGTTDVSQIAEQVLPSIVAIDVTQQVTSYTPFGPQSSEAGGSGSGIIIADKNDRLYIATNNHVVQDTDSVTIRFANDKTAKAVIRGTDPSHDLAVVEVDKKELAEETLSAIKVATVGDSSATKVGEQAIAIGNALGYGTSVTVGYISAKDREIDMEDSSSIKLLQTDAAINPGNSGGALVNGRGEVIGINSSKFASEEIEGMGFAIPMATAEPILTKLMNQEKIAEEEQAYLGITGRNVTSEYTEYYGMPEGIYISEVTEGSPAQKAGLSRGAIITEINGDPVKTVEEMQTKLTQCKAGDKGSITIQIADGGKYKEETVTVTFGKKESTSR